MTAVINLSFLALTDGTCPAFSAPRHDRNSTVGMIDNSPTAMKTENFVRKAWLWTALARPVGQSGLRAPHSSFRGIAKR
jgi:hypothetical protein